MYDIIIAGGGPAGATLARLAGNRYRVLLLEKRTFETDMKFTGQKSCGGLLDPDAQRMLAGFGLGIPKSVLVSPQLFAVRTIDIKSGIERYYQRHYINIDRNEFDKWLGSIIPSRVDIINGCLYRSYEEKDEYVSVKFRQDGREHEEKARLLVGADGAFSRVRRQCFGELNAPRLYISIQEWFRVNNAKGFYGAIFDDDITDFYSWTIPKEDEIILGSALVPGHDVLDRFELLKEKLKKYGFCFENSIKKNGAYLYRPVRSSQISIARGRTALVGEAAGFISPSSAEGMSYAFKSSLALARALEQGIDDYLPRYMENIAPLKRNILLKNLKSPAMYNGLLRKMAMGSGLLSIDIFE
ncbi:MAG: FAD-binding protein [Clostridiaceae bacterium]|jgi:flavin-dependent dehydrogenase|nr:FAD-binding protein [Clostridiaceae bacterium]